MRWRRIGDRRGRSAGGGWGETKDVGRQARRGGASVRGSGVGMYTTIFVSVYLSSVSRSREGDWMSAKAWRRICANSSTVEARGGWIENTRSLASELVIDTG